MRTGNPRLADYSVRHPQVWYDFNMSAMVPALPDLALAPSFASLPVVGPSAQIFVVTPMDVKVTLSAD